MSTLKLRDLLPEYPQTNNHLSLKTADALSKIIGSRVNSGELIGSANTQRISETLVFSWGHLNDNVYDVWLGIFHQNGVDLTLVFGAEMKQIGKMNGIPTYQVKVANKYYSVSGRKFEKQSLLLFLEDNADVQIASDFKISDGAEKVWLDILTDPTLEGRTYCWDVEKKQSITPKNPEDIFGADEKYKNVICILRPKVLTERVLPLL